MPRPTRRQELRHIVDVDGQLIGIDSPTVRPAQLLARAGICSNRRLTMMLDDREVLIGADQTVVLSERDVLFFRSAAVARSGSFLLRAA